MGTRASCTPVRRSSFPSNDKLKSGPSDRRRRAGAISPLFLFLAVSVAHLQPQPAPARPGDPGLAIRVLTALATGPLSLGIETASSYAFLFFLPPFSHVSHCLWIMLREIPGNRPGRDWRSVFFFLLLLCEVLVGRGRMRLAGQVAGMTGLRNEETACRNEDDMRDNKKKTRHGVQFVCKRPRLTGISAACPSHVLSPHPSGPSSVEYRLPLPVLSSHSIPYHTQQPTLEHPFQTRSFLLHLPSLLPRSK